MSSKKTKQLGFSIVEIVVVLAVLSIMSGISFTSWRSIKSDILIQKAAYQLANDIRIAAERALAGQEEKVSGIFLQTNDGTSYLFYEDKNKNYLYDNVENEKVVDVYFEGDVKISKINNEENTWVSIFFKSPNPTVFIRAPSGDAESFSKVEITLSLSSSPQKTKNVVVNKAGLIYVE